MKTFSITFLAMFFISLFAFDLSADNGGIEYFPACPGTVKTYELNDAKGSSVMKMKTFDKEIVCDHNSYRNEVWVDEALHHIFWTNIEETEEGGELKMYGLKGEEGELECMNNTLGKFPLFLGECWPTTSSNPTYVECVIADSEEVTVTAGTFSNCYKFETQPPAPHNFNWFCPNIGLVKQEHSSGLTMELVSYSDDFDDLDVDGWTPCFGDCDDDNAAANPGVEESSTAGNCKDGIDNDCDGTADKDSECDHYISYIAQGKSGALRYLGFILILLILVFVWRGLVRK